MAVKRRDGVHPHRITGRHSNYRDSREFVASSYFALESQGDLDSMLLQPEANGPGLSHVRGR